ncbi:MAG TPA: DUF4388 domain-containing protein [Holophagaceae bacterium]|nr:DUF4388 domain-containing protein [Holophagaceae bacterium]
MALKGNLATMGLEDLFQWLAVGKKTGVLVIRGSTHTKKVAFQEGRVIHVGSDDPKEYLGQFLIAHGRITEAQLREALSAQEGEKQILGRILVSRNLVREDEILRIVQFKAEETVYDAFLWDQGEFEFLEGSTPDPDTVLITLDVTSVVLEGARRRDEWKQIRELIKGGDAVLAPDPEAIAEQLPLASEDAELLARMDGQKTVDHLVVELRATEFKISHHLHKLYEKGLIRVVKPGGGKPAHAPMAAPAATPPPAPATPAARAAADRDKLRAQQEELRRALMGLPPGGAQQGSTQERAVHVDLDQIAELAIDLADLTQVNLSPGEAFMATRVTGVHTFRDLMSVAPFDAEECQAIFTTLVKRGILKAGRPASGSGRIGANHR